MAADPCATSRSIPCNPVRLYAGLVSAIEGAGGAKALGDLLAQLRTSGDKISPPTRDDPAVHRWLARFRGVPADAAGAAADALLQQTAEATSRQPAQVRLVFRAFV